MARLIVSALIFLLAAAVLPAHTTVNSDPSKANGLGLVGWGGTGLRMTDCSTSSCNATFPASLVFPGEMASVFEMEASELSALGYNTVRGSFNPGGTTFPSTGTNPCSQDTSGNLFGVYNATQLQRAIQIAIHYGLWLIVDYHSYDDMSPVYISCWMNGWYSIVNQFRYSYPLIIWEPLNEPSSLPGTAWGKVNYLGQVYNNWILQARSLGDTHHVVIENLCSQGCQWSVDNYWRGYPGAFNNSQPIIDPQARVYLSLHAGMGWNYDYPVHWNSCPLNCEFNVDQYYNYTTADQLARYFYLSMKNGTANTGWPILNTEGSALPHCGIVQACLNAELTSGLEGSAGYTNVTLRFIQTLTNYLSRNNPQFGWIWFPMASWTNDGSAGAGTYGAMSPNNGWGTRLAFPTTDVFNHGGPRYAR